MPLLCLLAGCAASTPSAELPPSLTMPCQRPAPLPERALDDREVEVLWGRDRAALAACGDRVEVLAGRSALGAANP